MQIQIYFQIPIKKTLCRYLRKVSKEVTTLKAGIYHLKQNNDNNITKLAKVHLREVENIREEKNMLENKVIANARIMNNKDKEFVVDLKKLN